MIHFEVNLFFWWGSITLELNLWLYFPLQNKHMKSLSVFSRILLLAPQSRDAAHSFNYMMPICTLFLGKLSLFTKFGDWGEASLISNLAHTWPFSWIFSIAVKRDHLSMNEGERFNSLFSVYLIVIGDLWRMLFFFNTENLTSWFWPRLLIWETSSPKFGN